MARQKNKENLETREIYYIIKHTVMEYSLMKMTLEGNTVVSDEKECTDIPAIIYGKLFRKARIQQVSK